MLVSKGLNLSSYLKNDIYDLSRMPQILDWLPFDYRNPKSAASPLEDRHTVAKGEATPTASLSINEAQPLQIDITAGISFRIAIADLSVPFAWCHL
jgi:hypothetical protein